MKKSLLTLLICLLLVEAKAQISFGYFPINHSMVQVTSNCENFLFGDIRLQTNSFISNSNIEIAPFLNIKRKTSLNIYWGLGISINPFNSSSNTDVLNGYFTTIGSRIKPLRNKQIALLFEISPYVNNSFGSGIIRTNLGLSYFFKKK